MLMGRTQLGQEIASQSWQNVHLIGHSAGSELIQEIANQLKSSPNPPTIQLTFLDPYVGAIGENLNAYGQNAAWSDEYYTAIDETSVDPLGTGLPLPKAYAVDVSWVDPNHQQAQYIGPGGGPVALSSHGYPIDFYLGSITGGNSSCSSGYGFSLSMEKEGASWIN